MRRWGHLLWDGFHQQGGPEGLSKEVSLEAEEAFLNVEVSIRLLYFVPSKTENQENARSTAMQ